jgi:hypothetical protein
MKIFRRPTIYDINGETPTPPLSATAQAVCCTGACGRFGGELHLGSAANVSIDSAIVRGDGTHTILFDSTAAGASTGINAPFAPANIWGAVSERLYVYFETLPSADTRILTHRKQYFFNN